MSAAAIIPLEMPEVHGLNLSVDTKKCQLIQDGIPLKRQGRAHVFTSASGETIAVRVYNTIFDPAPLIKINGIKHFLAPKLTLPQLLLVALPFPALAIESVFLADTPSFHIVLAFFGTYVCGRIVRSNRSTARKTALTLLTTLGCAILLFVATVAWQVGINFENIKGKYQERLNQAIVAHYADEFNKVLPAPPLMEGMQFKGVTAEGKSFVMEIVAPIEKDDPALAKLDTTKHFKTVCMLRDNKDLKDIDFSLVFRMRNTKDEVVYEQILPSSDCPRQ